MRDKRLRFIWFFLLLAVAATVTAQEELLLRITRVDAADFPIVRVNLITANAQGEPLSDLSALSLRENGIPIGDLSFSSQPVGVSVIFVIDANPTLQEIDDDSGLTRLEKVKDSIAHYARQFMSEQDLVSVVVPELTRESGRFLVEDASEPDPIIQAMADYDPESLNRTPLNEMLRLALAHAADNQSEGRYQAILLFTDGAQLPQQLTFTDLVSQAQMIDLPIFAAVLGARADANEISNVARLYEPTRATYVHMPTAADADAIYLTWGRQRSQTQISYQSLQTKSGRYPIAINIGTSRAVTEFDLTLTPADLDIALDSQLIRRIGNAPDSPLASLAPASYTIPVALSWPDGIVRELAAMTLLLDGQPRATPLSLEPDLNGVLTFELDIRDLDEGSYELMVQAVDVLGLSAISDPLTMTVEVDRPLPPTPTNVPTSTPVAIQPASAPPATTDLWLGLTLLATTGLAAILSLFWLRRRRMAAIEEPVAAEADAEAGSDVTSPGPGESAVFVAFLELLEASSSPVTHIRIEGDNVSIGRDHHAAQIVFSDPSVAKLHARIRKRDDCYWLYDEGSSSGTFHNYQRLGLAPQLLADGDTIHFGYVGIRFHFREAE
jgi:hypothetical protein